MDYSPTNPISIRRIPPRQVGHVQSQSCWREHKQIAICGPEIFNPLLALICTRWNIGTVVVERDVVAPWIRFAVQEIQSLSRKWFHLLKIFSILWNCCPKYNVALDCMRILRFSSECVAKLMSNNKACVGMRTITKKKSNKLWLSWLGNLTSYCNAANKKALTNKLSSNTHFSGMWLEARWLE